MQKQTILPFYSSADNKETEGFSNFFLTPIEENGTTFKSSEHYFMYHKAIKFKDFITAEKILRASTPRQAKVLGKSAEGYVDRVWKLHREEIMERALTLKFTQNEQLKERLCATKGKVLVEASPYDKVWGVGLSADNPRIYDPKQWRGQNLLGKVLMKVRDKLTGTPRTLGEYFAKVT